MQVSTLSIAFMALNMVIGIAIPAVLLIVLKKKYHGSVKPFFVGCGVMLLFALVLESVVHQIVLGGPKGGAIMGNLWFYAAYGGVMAGLFEESGRFLAMKFVIRREEPGTALMYGAGHGGFEMFFLLTTGMVNNLIYSVLINTGNAEVLLAPLDAAARATVEATFRTLTEMSPWLLLVSPMERISALILQMSLSVLMWNAVKRKKTGLGFACFAIHAAVDAAAVIINGLGAPMMLTEAVLLAAALGMAVFAKKISA